MEVEEHRRLSGPEGDSKPFWANVTNRVVPRTVDSHFILHDFQDEFEYPCYHSVAQKKTKKITSLVWMI